jgi:glucokinase
MAAPDKVYLSFDLGGTKMYCAVLDNDHKIITTDRRKTQGHLKGEDIYARIIDCIETAVSNSGVKQKQIAGLGMAAPGPLDPATGVILDSPNMGLDHFPLGDRLRKDLGIPVLIENDVNAGIFGEYVHGCAAGYRYVIGLFPGTGLGGGIVIDGRIYRGATGNAGELGHMTINPDGPLCGCGKYGCLEAYASRSAIVKDIAALAAAGKSPTVLAKAGTDMKKIKSNLIKAAMDAGEEPVRQIVERSARFLGIGMANCVNIFSPELIVLGGGLVEKLGKEYIDTAEAAMREYAMAFTVKDVKVKAATLGDDAAIMGAAALIRGHLDQKKGN